VTNFPIKCELYGVPVRKGRKVCDRQIDRQKLRASDDEMYPMLGLYVEWIENHFDLSLTQIDKTFHEDMQGKNDFLHLRSQSFWPQILSQLFISPPNLKFLRLSDFEA